MYRDFFKMMRSFIKVLMVIFVIGTIISLIVIFSEFGKFGGVVVFIGLAIVVSSFISFLCLYFHMKGIAVPWLESIPRGETGESYHLRTSPDAGD